MSSQSTPVDDKIVAAIRALRRFGLLFAALTLIMAAFLVFEAFDPSVPFRWGGVEVHSAPQRLLFVLPVDCIALFASFFAFAPRSIMERWLRYQFGEMEKMKERLRLNR